MSSGFITIHRKITEWEWYSDVNTFRVFFHLLVTANHKDKKWQGKLIKRGQVITGRIKLAADLNLSEQQIRTCLSKLKSTNEITIKTTNKNSLITLVKYSSYQDKDGKNNQLDNQQITNQQPTDNQQITTTNNDNNGNNENNKRKRVKKAFTPPTLEEVKEYSFERGYPNQAKRFFDYYTAGNWKDKNGTAVKNWKQKFISTWEKNNDNAKHNTIDNQTRDYGETSEGFLANFN